MNGGYLYLIENERLLKGWIKIGITTNLKKRIHTYNTGDPYRGYKVIYSLYHPDYVMAEKKIKNALEPFAKEIRGEWALIDRDIAKVRLQEQLSDYLFDIKD